MTGQLQLTREQLVVISETITDSDADSALVTKSDGRSDAFVALIQDDGSNVHSFSVDSLGAVSEEV